MKFFVVDLVVVDVVVVLVLVLVVVVVGGGGGAVGVVGVLLNPYNMTVDRL
jgi:hypothetical protein